MAVTVSGGGTTTLTFNVTSSSGTNFANDFPGSYPAVNTLSAGGTMATVAGALNVLDSGTSPAAYTIPGMDQYSFISTGQATTIDGSGAGDTLVGSAELTYIEAAGGHDNRVIFAGGNNTFDGSASGGAGDTIVGGSGYDTISTGAGPSTIYGGSGHTLAYLNDTVGGDVVVLQSGTTTVVGGSHANVDDTVSATASGSIDGGAGTLTFVGGGIGTPTDVTIVGGTGEADMFGGKNLGVTLEGGGTQIFVAGAGNETLDGSMSGGFAFFGDTSSGDSVNYNVTGGHGDFFQTGAGTEFFTAGSSDIFEIGSVTGAASISIADFSGSDSIKFDSPTVSGSSDGNNYTVTLKDGTTVEFVGITTPPTHVI